jgi:hypothetical protein
MQRASGVKPMDAPPQAWPNLRKCPAAFAELNTEPWRWLIAIHVARTGIAISHRHGHDTRGDHERFTHPRKRGTAPTPAKSKMTDEGSGIESVNEPVSIDPSAKWKVKSITVMPGIDGGILSG